MDYDITADNLPEGIKLYNHNWSILAGSITSSDIWKDYQDYYLNCIQDSDNNLMRVIDSLRENGMLSNTIIIFTADHGEMHGSHALKGKGGFMYENNIHVPFIIVHPDFQGGRKISALTSHIDIAPTLTDIAGLSEDLPGKSLMPLMTGEKDSVRESALFCYEMLSMSAPCVVSGDSITYDFTRTGRGMLRGIITADGFKFARWFSPAGFNTPSTLEDLYANNDVQAFDTENDPEEVNSITDSASLLRLNAAMNEIISHEIGTDNGGHVSRILNAIRSRQ